MASRISLMRNEMQQFPQQQPQIQSQEALNKSIEATKLLMQQMRMMGNRESAITMLLQQNPQLASLLPIIRNGTGLDAIAKQMAAAGGIDINNLISQLGGM